MQTDLTNGQVTVLVSYLQITLAQLASKRTEQDAFACTRRSQQKRHAPGRYATTQAVQDSELALVCFHQLHALQHSLPHKQASWHFSKRNVAQQRDLIAELSCIVTGRRVTMHCYHDEWATTATWERNEVHGTAEPKPGGIHLHAYTDCTSSQINNMQHKLADLKEIPVGVQDRRQSSSTHKDLGFNVQILKPDLNSRRLYANPASVLAVCHSWKLGCLSLDCHK